MDDGVVESRAGVAVMLRLTGWRCVVVGGGGVGLRRGRWVVEAGGRLVVVAPSVLPGLKGIAERVMDRGYREGDLAGARLVVTATDDAAVNERAAAEAAREGALVNRADAAERGDLTVMGGFTAGPITVGVDTGGSSAAAGKALRDRLREAVGQDWPVLLEEAKQWRKRLRSTVDDAERRSRRLRRLTDEEARRVLAEGGVEALRAHLRAVAEGG